MTDDNIFEVEYKYDMEVDALFINIKKDYEYDTSIELDNDVIMDFDKNSVPVALEVLNASRVLKTPKYSLNNINTIKMNVDINEKSIGLKVFLGVTIHNKEQIHSVDTFTSNDTGIPNIETELATV
jgi:uncharacterized protein YuzE